MSIRSSISCTNSFMSILMAMGKGPSTMEHLAKIAGMSKEALMARLCSMERLGLVESVPLSRSACSGRCHGCSPSCRCDSSEVPAFRVTDRGRGMLT